MINLDEDAEDGRVIAIQSLSNAQLIEILQHHWRKWSKTS
jgi:hypothetical protein